MANGRFTGVRETTNPDVGFRVDADGQWHIVDRVTNEDVGEPFESRSDCLLAITAMGLSAMGTHVEHRQTAVHRPGKAPKKVKNLGWLLRNWALVDHFEVESRDGHGGLLTAHLRDGGTYETEFADLGVLREWLRRPVFRGARLVWLGEEMKA